MFEKVYFDILADIVKNDKPYRNRHNEYPVLNRRHGYKYFKPIYETGKKFSQETLLGFDIYYYNTKLISVYKDDVVEIQEQDIYQGERHFLNLLNADSFGSCTQGYWNEGQIIFHDVRRGGSVYAKVLDAEGKYAVTLPLHRGMKYYMRSDEPVTKYDIVRMIVDRKKSHDILSGHKDGLKYIKTYWKSILSQINNSSFDELEKEIDERLKSKYSNTFFNDSEIGYILKDLIEQKDYATLGDLLFHRGKSNSNVFHSMKWRSSVPEREVEHAVNYMLDSFKHLVWDTFEVYKEISTPCELRYIPSNPMQKVVLRKETV